MNEESFWDKRLIIARRKQAYLQRVRSRTCDPGQQESIEAELQWTQCIIEDLQRKASPSLRDDYGAPGL